MSTTTENITEEAARGFVPAGPDELTGTMEGLPEMFTAIAGKADELAEWIAGQLGQSGERTSEALHTLAGQVRGCADAATAAFVVYQDDNGAWLDRLPQQEPACC